MNSQDRTKNIKNLKIILQKEKVDCFLLPSSDEFLNEYPPDYYRRLQFVTGFTGSYGIAVIFTDEKKRNIIFTDGRYISQIKNEIDGKIFDFENIARKNIIDFLNEEKSNNSNFTIGYDSKIFPHAKIKELEKYVQIKKINENPIDKIWHNRPQTKSSKIFLYEEKYTGESYQEKISKIFVRLKKHGCNGLLINDPHIVNFLFNVRGFDLECTPILLCHALLLSGKKPIIYLIDKNARQTLRSLFNGEIECKSPDNISSDINAISRDKKFLFDSNNNSDFFHGLLSNHEIVYKTDPAIKIRAIKNNIEIENAKIIHQEDGLAMIRFLSFLHESIKQNKIKDLNEIDLADKLFTFRKASLDFTGNSFPTISAIGKNSAIIHYQPQSDTAVEIADENIYLVDSGGQYYGGTTDITRVISLSTPTKEQKKYYTLVLKGHIAIANAKFPKGTNGSQLDILARQYLWQYGVDYGHGTGHGVGNFLSVHEGPQSISKKSGDCELHVGMILSNEPGYYEEDHYGIRIENLIFVKEFDDGFLGFENLTMCPIEKNLIDKAMLNTKEINWLNNYHKSIENLYYEEVTIEESDWLKKACSPL